MITEVRSDYYCAEEGCIYIDAWIDDRDDGFSVAKVYENPIRVVCQPGQEMHFADPIVQEEIVSVIIEFINNKEK